jgi:hypothetical protein
MFSKGDHVSDGVELEEESFPSFVGVAVFVSDVADFAGSADVFLLDDDSDGRLSFL